MTKQEFIQATKTLENKGYESIGSVMCDVPSMCGVHYIHPKTKAAFLLNKSTFNNLPQ